MTAPTPGPYYPAGDQKIDIVAYYPANAGSSFTVKSDQTSDADYKASDLMVAFVIEQAKQATAVNLKFCHTMAKLIVKPTVTFDHSTWIVGKGTGPATSIAISNEGAAVIPAQTIIYTQSTSP